MKLMNFRFKEFDVIRLSYIKQNLGINYTDTLRILFTYPYTLNDIYLIASDYVQDNPQAKQINYRWFCEKKLIHLFKV